MDFITALVVDHREHITDGMEFFLILLLIAAIIIFFILFSKIHDLICRVEFLENQLLGSSKSNTADSPEETGVEKIPENEIAPAIKSDQKDESLPAFDSAAKEKAVGASVAAVAKEPSKTVSEESANTESASDIQIDKLQKNTQSLWKSIINWLCVGTENQQHNVSREYKVSTTWLIRIGILSLLCAIGFYLKYSHDRNLLNHSMRILLMTVAGFGLTGFGLWKQNSKYRQLATAAIGTGVVTWYLTVMAACKLYGVLPQVPAFILMIIITIAAIATSVHVKALLPAMIGCIGGFFTPLLVPPGNMTPENLMLYFTVLTAGVSVVSFFRHWLLLTGVSFVLYAVMSLANTNSASILFAFLVMLNFVFYSVQIALHINKYNIYKQCILLIAGNWLLLFLHMFQYLDNNIISKLILLMPVVVSAALLYYLKSSKKLNIQKIYAETLYIQAAVSLTVLIPLLVENFEGIYYPFAAWTILAMLLTAAGICFTSKALITYSHILFLLFGSIESCYIFSNYAAGFNIETTQRVLACFISIFSLAVTGILILHKKRRLAFIDLCIAFIAFILFSGIEMHYFVQTHAWIPNYNNCLLPVYWSIAAAFSAAVIRRLNLQNCTANTIIILVLTGISIFLCQEPGAGSRQYTASLLFTLLTWGVYSAALFFCSSEISKMVRQEDASDSKASPFAMYRLICAVGCLIVFFQSSKELYKFLSIKLTNFNDGGLSIYWSLLAILFITCGILKRKKVLRYCGILLFAITFFKVFFYDMNDLMPLWRITAIFVVGVIMLASAIIYIKYQDVFRKDPDSQNDDEK